MTSRNRVAAVQQDVASRDVTADLADTARTFLDNMLHDLRWTIVNRRAPEQLLHGESHPGNVLVTKNGALFIDFEHTTLCPVEHDLGWVSPRNHRPLLRRRPRSGRIVSRPRDGDGRGVPVASRRSAPERQSSGVAYLDVLRDGPPRPSLDDVTWAAAWLGPCDRPPVRGWQTEVTAGGTTRWTSRPRKTRSVRVMALVGSGHSPASVGLVSVIGEVPRSVGPASGPGTKLACDLTGGPTVQHAGVPLP